VRSNASFANNRVCQIYLLGADAPTVYKSDSVWSHELGTKNKIGDGRADVMASVFRIDWSNIQSLIFMPTCGNIYTNNLGKAISPGGDVELHAQLVRRLTLSASAGYTDAHNTEATTRIRGGGTVMLAADGAKFAIPKISGSAALYYEHALFGTGHDGYLNIAWDYASSYERNPPAGVCGADPGTTHAEVVQSLSARFGARFSGFNVSMLADNLTNAHPELPRYLETTASGVFRGRTLRPRTLGIAATYAF